MKTDRLTPQIEQRRNIHHLPLEDDPESLLELLELLDLLALHPCFSPCAPDGGEKLLSAPSNMTRKCKHQIIELQFPSKVGIMTNLKSNHHKGKLLPDPLSL